jgi:hypothetical protein
MHRLFMIELAVFIAPLKSNKNVFRVVKKKNHLAFCWLASTLKVIHVSIAHEIRKKISPKEAIE